MVLLLTRYFGASRFVGMKFDNSSLLHPNFKMPVQVVHPADLCYKLPENVSLEEGAMCEPLSVGVHACRRANINPETRVLIMGAGPIGLITLLAARAFGAPRIVIVDIDDCRLSIAKSLGADETVLVSTNIQVLYVTFKLLPKYFSSACPHGLDFAELYFAE